MSYAAILVTGVCALAAGAQVRDVPFPWSSNSTGPEIKEKERRIAALEAQETSLAAQFEAARQSGADTSPAEQALSAVREQLEELNLLPKETRDILALARARIDSHVRPLVPDQWAEQAVSAEQAQALVDLFYDDWGDGQVNRRWQDLVLLEATYAAQHPRVDRAACKVLRDGVLAYYEGVSRHYPDGLLVSPRFMETLSEALSRVAEPDDAQARQVAQSLYRNAVEWLGNLDRPDDAAELKQRLRPLLETAAELDAAYPAAELGSERAREERQIVLFSGSRATLSVQEAIRRIRNHLRRFTWDIEKVREITELGLADYGNERDNRAMRQVFYTAYGHILRQAPATFDRDESGANQKTIVAHIETTLLALAQNNRVPEGRQTWWWRGAVQTLGNRASAKLREFVRTTAESKDKHVLKEACQILLQKLGPDQKP